MKGRDDLVIEAMDNPETLDLIKELNTQEQLFLQGVDAEGVSLDSIGGSYSWPTIIRKKIDGLPFDHTTLYQTGEAYESYEAVVQGDRENKAVIMTMNTIKESGPVERSKKGKKKLSKPRVTESNDLQDRYGYHIVGLHEQSMQKVIIEIEPKIHQIAEDWLSGNHPESASIQ